MLFRLGVYPEGSVTHAEPGMPTLFAVGGGAAEVLLKKEREAPDGALEVVLGIHRQEHFIRFDAFVKRLHQAGKGSLAANSFEQRGTRISHWQVVGVWRSAGYHGYRPPCD